MLPIVLFCFIGATFAVQQTYGIKEAASCFGEPVANAPVDLKYINKGRGSGYSKHRCAREITIGLKDADDLENDNRRVFLEIGSSCDKDQREDCNVLTAVSIPSSPQGKKGYEATPLNQEKRNPVMNSCDSDETY